MNDSARKQIAKKSISQLKADIAVYQVQYLKIPKVQILTKKWATARLQANIDELQKKMLKNNKPS
jgi:hypothetical protein